MRPRSRLVAHQSKGFQERKHVRVVEGMLLVVVCFTVWLFAAYRFTQVDMFSIRTVSLDGGSDVATSALSTAYDFIDGTYVGIFPKSNAYLVPRQEIAAAIQALSPRIDSVLVKLNGLNDLHISIFEKQPTAVVCAALPDISSGTNFPPIDSSCFATDDRGLIIDTASTSLEKLNRYYLPDLQIATSSSNLPIGTYATSTSEFSSLQAFYIGLRKGGMNPLAILMKPNGEYELYVTNQIVSKPNVSIDASDAGVAVIYFNNSRPFGDELANLIPFWKNLRDSYNEIDLRYGSNVFYRKSQ